MQQGLETGVGFAQIMAEGSELDILGDLCRQVTAEAGCVRSHPFQVLRQKDGTGNTTRGCRVVLMGKKRGKRLILSVRFV